MVTHPAQLLILNALGLACLAILGIAAYVIYRAYKRPVVAVSTPRTARTPHKAGDSIDFRQEPNPRRKPLLAVALLMLAWVFGGKYLVALFFPASDGSEMPAPIASSTLVGPSGAELAVRKYGTEGAPVLVMTHGWGADSSALEYLIAPLTREYEIVVWDLPGLGASSPPRNGEYSMKQMAADLGAVVDSVPRKPVVLVGHSIGGMLNIEHAREHATTAGGAVLGIVQVNSTYTNPLQTKKGADRSVKLQDPVLEPMLELVTAASPVARALGWLAYRSGLAHIQLATQSFAGAQTWRQLDHMARYAYRSSPAVVAQGVLAMINWDGSDVLNKVGVPTLIVSGAQDITTLPAASEHMASAIRNARHVSVSPAAHFGPIEQNGRYSQAIAGFAAGLGGGTAVAAQ